MIYLIGLTGGIGSGKSAAAALFATLGAAVVDTDVIAHRLTAAGGLAIPAIRAAFGDDVIAPDGAMDRAAMRQKVFSQADAKARLEGILHPMIREETLREVDRVGASAPYVLLVVPLMIETGFYLNHIARLVVVDCPESMQIDRVAARSGLSADEVRAIMANQASRAARLEAADDVIDNSGDLEQLRRQVLNLHAQYQTLARAG
ncbi:MAG: hypothetical protein AMXMBFR6_00110 [Betaproteobacteria bacterium]|jgi:dephospho-CoA kinase|nr:dephospho-CoA kinase [Rhodocyclaceae bacterium]MCG3187021.1 Dephospho-CoA kinase [Rhodocyclaceae bacterium]